MKTFIPCSHCGRHVRLHASSCPFCDTKLGLVSAPLRTAVTLAIGLGLCACFDDSEPSDDMSQGSAAGETGDTDASGPGMSSSPTGTATTPNTTDPWDSDQGGEDYGGFGDTGDWPQGTTGGTGGETTDTGGTGGTGSTGGTGEPTTGDFTSTSEGPSDSGGEDYAGPETDTI